jgi:hypothetical protein
MAVTTKRALQLLLAIVLVVIGFAVIMSIPWKQMVREIQKPRSVGCRRRASGSAHH